MDGSNFTSSKIDTINMLALHTMITLWPDLEEIFIAMVNQRTIYLERKEYAKSFNKNDANFLLTQRIPFDNELGSAKKTMLNTKPFLNEIMDNFTIYKYKTVNFLRALLKYGTIEFRIANGTSNLEEILSFASLYDRFILTSIQSVENPKIMQNLTAATNRTISLEKRAAFLLNALYTDSKEMREYFLGRVNNYIKFINMGEL